jgi:hypothetical protein
MDRIYVAMILQVVMPTKHGQVGAFPAYENLSDLIAAHGNVPFFTATPEVDDDDELKEDAHDG